MTDILHGLMGSRVHTGFVACLHCGGRDGVLLQHLCKDELELYCDWCERWTGCRITRSQVRAWVEMAGGPVPDGWRRTDVSVNLMSRDMSRPKHP